MGCKGQATSAVFRSFVLQIHFLGLSKLVAVKPLAPEPGRWACIESNFINMTTKTINKILSGLFLVDYVYGLILIINILMVWTPITDYYTGTTLFLFVGKLCLYTTLGLVVIVALFMNHKKGILVSLPLYVAVIFGSKLWQIKPNSVKFQDLIQKSHEAIETGKVIFSDVKATDYPSSLIYIFYVLCVIYVLFIMPRTKDDQM